MSAPDRIWVTYNAKAIATDMPRFHSDVEYTRLDPETRVVTVDQLDRWAALIRQLDIQDDYGWNIGDNSVGEIRAIIGEVK